MSDHGEPQTHNGKAAGRAHGDYRDDDYDEGLGKNPGLRRLGR